MTASLKLAVPADHVVAAQRRTELQACAEDTFLLGQMGSANGFSAAVMESFRRAGIYPPIRSGILQTDMILNLIARGGGVSLVTGLSTGETRAGVVFLDLAEPVTVTLSLITGPTASKVAQGFETTCLGGHLGVAEDAGPFPEGQVGGDDHRGLLVELAHEVEEQLAPGSSERQIAQLVEHHEIKPDELRSQMPGFAQAGLFLQTVHQIDDTARARSAGPPRRPSPDAVSAG